MLARSSLGWRGAVLAALPLAAFLILVFVAPALAADDATVPEARTLVLPQTQLIAALVGSLVPAVTYLLNDAAPWVSEAVKALVLVLTAAIGGALTQLLDAGGIPLDWGTVQVIGTAVVLAFLSHMSFWKPSTIAAKLKAGQNAQDKPGL